MCEQPKTEPEVQPTELEIHAMSYWRALDHLIGDKWRAPEDGQEAAGYQDPVADLTPAAESVVRYIRSYFNFEDEQVRTDLADMAIAKSISANADFLDETDGMQPGD